MRHSYKRNAHETYEYALITEPPEAIFWTTFRLKKSHIKLKIKLNRREAAVIKQEMFDDIKATEQK